MSAADAVARTLVLVPWLLERPGATVAAAAAAVGTTERQLVADLDVLQYCGLPGRLGGDLFEVELIGDRIVLRLAPVFDRPVRPTPTEALALVLALDTVAAALGDELPGLAAAVATLRTAAGVPAGVVATPEDGRAWLPALREAIAAGRAVTLRYRGRGDEATRGRVVEPWQLVLHRGRWYLHAHDRASEDHRTFRLDRVDGLEEMPSELMGAPRPDGPLPLPAWHPGPDDTTLELAIGPGGDWVGQLLDDVEELGPDARGWRRVRVSSDAPRFVVDLVLAAGGTVELVGPPRIRTALVTRARDALERLRGGA